MMEYEAAVLAYNKFVFMDEVEAKKLFAASSSTDLANFMKQRCADEAKRMFKPTIMIAQTAWDFDVRDPAKRRRGY